MHDRAIVGNMEVFVLLLSFVMHLLPREHGSCIIIFSFTLKNKMENK